jgi:N-methylhydantoinase A/oxoprolinase/acetone carboxylase beta subunit
LHACALAAGLGVPRAIVPPGPGLFSAAGLLTSPLKVALMRPVLTAAAEARPHELAALFAAMAAEAISELTRQGAAPTTIEVAPTLDLRYAGQSYELAVSAEPETGDWVDGVVARFHERHREVYGYASPEHAVEIVAARTTATAPAGTATAPGPPPSAPAGVAPEPRSVREVYFDEVGGFTPTPVFWRDDLPVGTALAGPAVVEQYDSTTLLHPGWRLVVDGTGNLVLQAGDA